MHHLAGHPNIVVLRSAFEDKHHVHLVLDLCGGGGKGTRQGGLALHWDACAAGPLFDVRTALGSSPGPHPVRPCGSCWTASLPEGTTASARPRS